MPRDLSCCSESVPAKAPQWRLVTRSRHAWKPAEGVVSDAAASSGLSPRLCGWSTRRVHEVVEIGADVDDGSALTAEDVGKFFGVFDDLCGGMRHWIHADNEILQVDEDECGLFRVSSGST